MDEAARGLGLDPAEIRRRNFIAAGAFPYRTATGQVYDSGDYHLALDRALEAADYAGLRREQAERRKRGEIVGIGLASYVEPCALGWESGSLKVERSGRVTAITGSSAHGQGHETTFAQIVADHLGVTPDEVEVLHGDTRSGPGGLRHLRQPQRGPRRQRAGPRVGGAARQGPAHRGQAARGRAGRHRRRCRRLSRGGIARAARDVARGGDGGLCARPGPAARRHPRPRRHDVFPARGRGVDLRRHRLRGAHRGRDRPPGRSSASSGSTMPAR